MKEIPLTRGLFAIVDDEDFEEINKHKWFAQRYSKSSYLCYAARRESITFRLILMHRQIMKTPKGMDCDHINHNTLDNQKSNLRNCTHKENLMNTKVHFDNKLGEKGITLTSSNTYQVRLYKDGKSIYNKKFKTLDEAKKARDKITEIHHGSFANK